MTKTTKEFLTILRKNGVQETIIPSLNLWALYVFITVITWSVFDFGTAVIIFAFGPILFWAQTDEVKKGFREWWYGLPVLKFHGIMLFLIVGTLLGLIKFTNFLIPIGNIKTKKYE